MQPIHSKLLVIVSVSAFTAALYASGEQVSWSWVRALSVPTIAVGSGFWLFDHWLWRLKPLQGWLVKRPNLAGKWTVEIKSTWEDESGASPSRSGWITIKQTYSDITFVLETPESVGSLVGSELISLPQGRFRFCGSYLNEPKAEFRKRSEIHYGTFLLAIEGAAHRPSSLVGSYWTDRKTTGSMIAMRA